MENIDTKIEEARQSFMSCYKKQRLYNNIALVVVVALIIVAYVVLQAWLGQNYFAIGAVAVILGLLFVYSRISRTKMEKSTKNYIRQYYSFMKEKVFPDDRFPNSSMDFEKKLDLSVFTGAGILNNIYRINSRGVISFEYQHQNATICDMAAYTSADAKQSPSFLGKFLSVPLALNFSGRILVYLKPKVQGKGPDCLEDVKKVEETDRYTIYATDSSTLKVLPTNFIRLLETLEVDDLLVDATFSIRPDQTQVALSYTDALMVIPLQNAFDKDPSDRYAKNIQVTFALLDALK